MPLADFFDLLEAWTARGWLRPIDKAFVIFLNRQDPSASSVMLLGAALASHQLGRGHICLDVASALADPNGTLSLPLKERQERICRSNPPSSFATLPRKAGEPTSLSPLLWVKRRAAALWFCNRAVSICDGIGSILSRWPGRSLAG